MSAGLAGFIVVCCMLSTALAQSSSPPTAYGQSQSTNASVDGKSRGFVLEDGTAVTLRLGRSLSSADAHAGDRVDFEVAEEISVNRIVVIPKDSRASGTVIEAHKKRRMGRAGKLDVTIDSVQLVDGEKVTLRAVKESQGGSHTGIMAGGMVATSLIVWPAAPVFLLMHGKDVTIPKGTEVTAYVNGDVKLDPAKFQPALVPAATSDSATQPVPTSSPAATPNAAPSDTTPASPDQVSQDQGAAAELEVTSTPGGADIEIDGNFVGNTPSTLGVAAGPHQVSVKKTGFKPWERKITVSSGHIKIDAALESQSN
ncbi:MAG TPA: PEGA domain-containing protein [Candidatus Sulfotelmatobacter sp.]|nr:PEGA domain-containing protein [Candidatus Sulfotelmatobacter sp.]